jgi:hypothetical protein
MPVILEINVEFKEEKEFLGVELDIAVVVDAEEKCNFNGEKCNKEALLQ